MRSKQQPRLPGFGKLDVIEFGGSLLKGNPRERRPISIKQPMHLVMRSELACGDRSFLKKSNARRIEPLVRRLAKEKGVKLYRFANSGNHLHFLVLPSSKKAFYAYIRAISGLIARISLGVERGKAKGLKFWDARPYTKIVEWGREFRSVCNYILRNTLEAVGFIPYQPRRGHGTRKASRKRGPPIELAIIGMSGS
jgi:REP element-mobilizing transposase RayT